jgi:DNA-binding NarL/FixJ family response regulator
MDNSVSVVLVDDHVLFRTGFKMLLNNLPNLQVVGEASNGEEFLDIIATSLPDLVFLDIAMPVMDGCVAAQRALCRYPDLKIIVLSMYGDEMYYYSLVQKGVKGFLMKSSDFQEVQMAIKTVLDGGNFFSRELMTNLVLNIKASGSKRFEVLPDLSERELEILIEVCKGASNVEIADNYNISKRTVEKHRANILLKTNCKNTASLVVYAIKNHLIEL